MPTIHGYTLASGAPADNEDWFGATDDAVVVLDGATIRTETGCTHGLQWYVRRLGAALLDGAADTSRTLREVLADAIGQVRALHVDTCDLNHPGTPSAAVGIVRQTGDHVEWLVLADITVMVQTDDNLLVEVDNRVSETAPAERAACDQYLIGTEEKLEAIVAMKHLELAARNVDGGYWVASVVPEAAEHARTGSWPTADVRSIGVCSDGTMRCLRLTTVTNYAAAMAVLAASGPQWLVDYVRAAEDSDPQGARWPRNKARDDATAVYLDFRPQPPTPSKAGPS